MNGGMEPLSVRRADTTCNQSYPIVIDIDEATEHILRFIIRD